ARTSRRRVTADHEFLFVNAFELDPCAAPPSRLVFGAALFADQALQAALLHFHEQRFYIAANLTRISNRIRNAFTNFRENLLSLLNREFKQALAIQLQQIEYVESQRRFSAFHLERLQELK